jgi:glycosyltransferase involved in cell wall biosynthesis
LETAYVNLVSIGMPVFNDKAFIHQALDSLLDQTYPDIELILSDDCSTDGSSEICLQYAAKDSRIRYIRQPQNIGISRNMEFLLNQARGKYFMWAANDDEWHPDFIRLLLEGLKKTPEAVVAFCSVTEIDEQGNPIKTHDAMEIDYAAKTPEARIKRLIKVFYDGFGYGLFIRDRILGVRFPVWWWINRSCAYNNIYPTLCFYLVKGDYVHCGDRPLWFNRMKNQVHIHHKVPYYNHFVRGYFAFVLRRFNLVVFSLRSIRSAGGQIGLRAKLFFPMMTGWFLKPACYELIASAKRLVKGDTKFW